MSARRNQARRAKKKIEKVIAKLTPEQVQALKAELEGESKDAR
jgi:hypothetical protein